MHRNAYGDLVMSRDARIEAVHYYELAEDLARQLEKELLSLIGKQ